MLILSFFNTAAADLGQIEEFSQLNPLKFLDFLNCDLIDISSSAFVTQREEFDSQLSASSHESQTEIVEGCKEFSDNDLPSYVLDDAVSMEIEKLKFLSSHESATDESEDVFTLLETAKLSASIDENFQNVCTVSTFSRSSKVVIKPKKLNKNFSKNPPKLGRPKVSENVHLEKLITEYDPKKRRLLGNNAASIRNRRKKSETLRKLERKEFKQQSSNLRLQARSNRLEIQIQKFRKVLD